MCECVCVCVYICSGTLCKLVFSISQKHNIMNVIILIIAIVITKQKVYSVAITKTTLKRNSRQVSPYIHVVNAAMHVLCQLVLS